MLKAKERRSSGSPANSEHGTCNPMEGKGPFKALRSYPPALPCRSPYMDIGAIYLACENLLPQKLSQLQCKNLCCPNCSLAKSKGSQKVSSHEWECGEGQQNAQGSGRSPCIPASRFF